MICQVGKIGPSNGSFSIKRLRFERDADRRPCVRSLSIFSKIKNKNTFYKADRDGCPKKIFNYKIKKLKSFFFLKRGKTPEDIIKKQRLSFISNGHPSDYSHRKQYG